MTSATAPSSSLVSLDAVSLSRAIHRREVSCVEVLEAFLVQIDQQNPTVNAIVAMPDPDTLFAQAHERDAQLGRKQSMGVLHGFPQAPKDIAPVAGRITWSAWAMSAAVRVPPGRALSCSPFTMRVGEP